MPEIITDLKMPSRTSANQGFACFDGIPFREHHQKDDAVMVPDKGFTKQLKALDPELEVMWDWASAHWSIWHFPKDKLPYHVLTVETATKSYRELGQDILLKLQECIHYKVNNLNIVDYIEEHNNQIRRRNEKDFKNKIHAIATDTWAYSNDVLQVSVPRTMIIGEAIKDG